MSGGAFGLDLPPSPRRRECSISAVAHPRFEPATEDVAVRVSALKMFGSLPKLGRSHWANDAILLETAVIPGLPPGLPPIRPPSTPRSDPRSTPCDPGSVPSIGLNQHYSHPVAEQNLVDLS